MLCLVIASGGWSDWSEWSVCQPVTRQRYRTRRCDNPKPFCSGSCIGNVNETSPCCEILGEQYAIYSKRNLPRKTRTRLAKCEQAVVEQKTPL